MGQRRSSRRRKSGHDLETTTTTRSVLTDRTNHNNNHNTKNRDNKNPVNYNNDADPSPKKKRATNHPIQKKRKEEVVLPDPSKTTCSMRSSLKQFCDTLKCPLCHEIMVEPTTLPCAHSFCLCCIRDYSSHSWTCPVPGCSMPVSIRGNRNGSYLKINPSLETAVTSFQSICRVLKQAPKGWWIQQDEYDDDEQIEENVNDTEKEEPEMDFNTYGDNNNDGHVDDGYDDNDHNNDDDDSRTRGECVVNEEHKKKKKEHKNATKTKKRAREEDEFRFDDENDDGGNGDGIYDEDGDDDDEDDDELLLGSTAPIFTKRHSL